MFPLDGTKFIVMAVGYEETHFHNDKSNLSF